MAPKNKRELSAMMKFTENFDSPVAIRFPRGEAVDVYDDIDEPVVLGKSEILQRGSKIAILAVGSCVKMTKQINNNLLEKGFTPTIINVRFIKPFDTELIEKIAKEHELIVTMEENVCTGGFGQSVLSYLNNKETNVDVINIGLEDKFIEHGKVDVLMSDNNLDADKITSCILKRIKLL